MAWGKSEACLIIPGPWSHDYCFYYDSHEDRCFSVSSDDILTPNEVYELWHIVEAAGKAEIDSFVTHGVFGLAAYRSTSIDNW